MKLSPARKAAFDALLKIENEHAFSSVLLPAYENGLSDADRGLCHTLVLGCLRKQILLDRYIEALVEKPKLDNEVRVALRIGLFQLYFLDRVPEHAAVNESVELAVRSRKSSARGLVNAVLRNAIRSKPEIAFGDEIDRIATLSSHPRWLLERWIDQFGFDEAKELARANNQTPSIAFRRTLKAGPACPPEIYRSSEFVEGCYFADSFSEDLKEMSERGDIYFQDEASQMVAASVEIGPSDTFLDVCASPGGKTTAIAERVRKDERRHGLLVAGDLTRRRVELLRETCRKQGAGSIEIIQYDAVKGLPFAEGSFSTILVDAPCTGTGTIRHNPEIRYFLSSQDFHELQATQLAILGNSSKLIAPGGKLVYSTCSMEREENEDVCRTFLAESPEFHLLPGRVPPRFRTTDGFARTFPHRDGMDGFFIATFGRSRDTKH